MEDKGKAGDVEDVVPGNGFRGGISCNDDRVMEIEVTAARITRLEPEFFRLGIFPPDTPPVSAPW